MTVVGVDGCRTGWYFVRIGTGTPRWGVCPTAVELFSDHNDADLILIDIPIGLRDEGPTERHCDKAARKMLGRRGSSVFPAPSRPALYEPSYEAASAVNRRLTGRGLSKQSWAIVPKIREMDALLAGNANARAKIREVHPEVCFTQLNGGHPMSHNKKTPGGATERLRLLTQMYPKSPRILESRRPTGVARDDVIDALGAAVTGLLIGELRTLPPNPERDGNGLPMEMIYRMVPNG